MFDRNDTETLDALVADLKSAATDTRTKVNIYDAPEEKS